MQAAPGARGRHVQQSRCFLIGLAAFDACQIPINRVLVAARFRDGREQQFPSMLQPQQQALFVPTRD